MVLSKRFICKSKNFNKVDSHVAAPYFRRTFEITDIFQKAEVTVCGLGFYKIFLNGKELTKSVIATGYYNPDDILYYDNYDLTPFVVTGKNVLALVLGNGLNDSIDVHVWNFEDAKWRSSPKLALAFEIDGNVLFEADGKFVCADSPITFDDLRCGTHYDSTKEIKGWNKVNFDDSTWKKAVTADVPNGIPTLFDGEPVIIEKKIKPVSVTKMPSGNYIYDFGENNAGVCMLKIKGERGQKITFSHAEFVNDGKLYWRSMVNGGIEPIYYEGYVQQDEFICSGKTDKFIPPFTFHGFRYVEVSGITDKQAKKSLLTYLVMHADLEKAGRFSCDDKIINAVQTCTERSNLANMVFVPTDCPHREKNGWTGDVTFSAEQFLYNHKAERFLRSWLGQILLAQNEQGTYPGIVPTGGWGFAWGNGPAWDAVVIELAYRIYVTTGDVSVFEQISDSWERYIAYMETKRKINGLFEYGLPDWSEAGCEVECIVSTPLEVSDSLVCAYMYKLSENMFNILGKTELAQKCADNRAKLLKAFKKEWVDGVRVKCDTISAQALAVYHGVFNEAEKKSAVTLLVKMIDADKYGFRVGVIGGRILFEVLTENGYGELAYKLITKEEFPSYGYNIRHGATTLWESFNEYKDGTYVRKDGGRTLSHNHHFWGFVSTWFYKYLAGINLVDEKTTVIKPYFVKNVNEVRAERAFKKGCISINMKKTETEVSYKIRVRKVNASFVCPKGYVSIENGKEFLLKNGMNKFVLVKE